MRWIGKLCIANLRQRKMRTLLTVLGVVIGVIAIVSLLALGIGMKEQMVESMEEFGSAREIYVYGQNQGKRKDRMLTDRKIEQMTRIEHVASVYPQQSVQIQMRYGNYVGYVEMSAVPQAYMKTMHIVSGDCPDRAGVKPSLLLGAYTMELLYHENSGNTYIQQQEDALRQEVLRADNAQDPEQEYDEEQLERVSEKEISLCAGAKLTGERVDVTLGEGEDAQTVKLSVAGITDQAVYNSYCDLDLWKQYARSHAKNGVALGQPETEDGSAYTEWIYDRALIEVDDEAEVETVVRKLQKMGYQTENNKELLESTNRQLQMIELLLGGIGMVALLIAVIGIGNTMTTSVYDRIGEIGILKVLGCDPEELRAMFLTEAAIIGGIGGVIGIILSFGICKLCINRIAAAIMNLPKNTDIAVIPVWLVIAAFVFSVVLGVLAGWIPAVWAGRMRPIDAMRKE